MDKALPAPWVTLPIAGLLSDEVDAVGVVVGFVRGIFFFGLLVVDFGFVSCSGSCVLLDDASFED
jgi:hypothetical protein